ncbi:Uncharacterised protein [uncultured Clostridium sp.]|uniref:hypothetical protein n=1 Tax=uncultured Clostridium sp. TaxID=59620 RepID=UPI000821051E|nr:hypothetical protein [uncultured Clostridium sp.]SCJ71219.1 Uncharacterised protein [uncultured Clostridium sp.]
MKNNIKNKINAKRYFAQELIFILDEFVITNQAMKVNSIITLKINLDFIDATNFVLHLGQFINCEYFLKKIILGENL